MMRLEKDRTARGALFVGASLFALAMMPAPEEDPGSAPSPGGRLLGGSEAQAATCSTAGCHADLGERKHVHGPVELERCTACHAEVPGGTPLQPGPAHRFDLVEADAFLCFECHEKIGERSVVHEPIKKRMCTVCHDPHGSDNSFFLRVSPVADLCFQCHRDTMRDDDEIHGPVAIGQCTACHDPHESDHPYRLVAEGPESCYICHNDKQHEFFTGNSAHPPIREDCGNCHDPHDSKHQYRLRKGVPNLCLSCHEDKQKHLEEVSVSHGAIDDPQSCLNCHLPHVAEFPHLLRDVPKNLCLGCHDRTLDTEFGRIKNMKAYLEEHEFHHGPIREGDCTACHNPHGDNNWRMLKHYFPARFYSGFDVENYALCFSCHQPMLALQEQTNALTGFRNADKNLHFVHVNKEKKGRTCRACHDFHATSGPKMVTDSTMFGQWTMSIGFEKTPTGGSCAPGCHTKRGYDRIEEVFNVR